MIRLVIRIDDATMAANVGGSVHTTYRTFDIEHPELEKLLRASGEKPDQFCYATLSGAALVDENDGSERGSSLPK